MDIIKRYFQSFDSFIEFVYGLRRRTKDYYYHLFQNLIRKRLKKNIRKYNNRLFISGIIKLLSLPDTLKLTVEEAQKIRVEADLAIKGNYNLLGSGNVILLPIDWHIDFKTGHRWPPGKFYKNYIQEEIDSDSDVKVPRELSRFHQLLKLGISYKISKDEKYSLASVAHMVDWIKGNPLMYSINWGCTMDVSIRAVNWIWILSFIAESNSLNDEVLEKIKISLYEHGWFIYRNPEKGYYYNHNHYLADLAGQIHLGLIFKNLIEPQKWLEKGKKELFKEIRLQILPTGMSYERSTNYNRLVLELILIPILLLKENGHEIPQDIWYRLQTMFNFIMYSLKPDCTTPIIGDQDDGRLLPFGIESNIDYRYLMSLGAILFKRPDFKKFGNGFNVYCTLLAGENALEIWNNLNENEVSLASKAFPDAGFYIMRNKDNYLIFNVSGKSMYPELVSGTHTHCDLLSFELYAQGKTFLVDPGSFVYTADADERMKFRSTQMHNTVTIDGESQNVIKREVLWDFERNAIPKVIKWISNDNLDQIIAEHNGYARLPQPVYHERTLTYDKINNKWIIIDNLYGEGKHKFEWFFHFDTGIDFRILGNAVETLCNDGNNLRINFSGTETLSLKKDEAFISKGYGEKEPGFVLVASIQIDCPITIAITINPITGNETNI